MRILVTGGLGFIGSHLVDALSREKNNIIISINKGSYGSVYFISGEMKTNWQIFGGIWERFGKK